MNGQDAHDLLELLETVYRKVPAVSQRRRDARTFEPGERVEVDYAGRPIEWYDVRRRDPQGLRVRRGLGFSQFCSRGLRRT